MTPSRDRAPLAAAIDTALVVAFVAVGRRNHDEDPGLAGLVATGAPFLLGLAVGWVVARAWDHPTAVRSGLVIWPVTVAVGLLVRWVTGAGTAPPFVVVATVVLGTALVGWRALGQRGAGGRGRGRLDPSSDHDERARAGGDGADDVHA
ncbi:DUF3054 domain-containing protein [Ilumatobacter sp.]|uniref:DUF3054 domain-containing protein n=1 Tax=Ilumatobacter sp. TaxID=1967498 RepID=UPI003B522A3B